MPVRRGLNVQDASDQSEVASDCAAVGMVQGEGVPDPSTYVEMNFRDSGLLLPLLAKDSALERMAAVRQFSFQPPAACPKAAGLP